MTLLSGSGQTPKARGTPTDLVQGKQGGRGAGAASPWTPERRRGTRRPDNEIRNEDEEPATATGNVHLHGAGAIAAHLCELAPPTTPAGCVNGCPPATLGGLSRSRSTGPSWGSAPDRTRLRWTWRHWDPMLVNAAHGTSVWRTAAQTRTRGTSRESVEERNERASRRVERPPVGRGAHYRPRQGGGACWRGDRAFP